MPSISRRARIVGAGASLFWAWLGVRAEDPAGTFTPPPFLMLRYNEDYSYLRDPSLATESFDELKFIPFQSPSYLSLGGEVRLRYEHYTNPDAGLGPYLGPGEPRPPGEPDSDYGLLRVALNADLHLGPQVRVFIQTISGFQAGGRPPVLPTEEDEFDLQQAFVEIDGTKSPEAQSFLRLGRQEVTIGSGRFVSIREPSNVHLNFDGAFGQLALVGPGTVSAFYLVPVAQMKGVLDDAENQRQALWGIYFTNLTSLSTGPQLDVYYFGYSNTAATYQIGTGDERRQTVGFRLHGHVGRLTYETEDALQIGRFEGRPILAWALIGESGYNLDQTPISRLYVRGGVASGDPGAHDARLETFNPLFPNLSYFNDASLGRPSNIIDVHPGIELRPVAGATISFGGDFFWRQRTGDATFTPAGAILIPAGSGMARFIGTAIDLTLARPISRHWTLSVSLVRLFAGPVDTDDGGKSVSFAQTTLACKF